MTELDPHAKALIEATAAGDDPSAVDKARLRGKLFASIAVGVGTTAGTAAAAAKGATAVGGAGAGAGGLATGGAAASGTAMATKVLAVVALASATTFGGVKIAQSVATRSEPTPMTASPRATAAVTPPVIARGPSPSIATGVTDDGPLAEPASTVVVAAAPPAEVGSPPNRTSRPAATTTPEARASAEPPASSQPAGNTETASPVADPRPPAAAPVSSSTIREETALLREAHAALESGDGTRALAILDQHAQRFPGAALGEEREAERVLAFCALGRQPEAKAYGTRFLESHPRSPLANRVRGSCATR